MLSGRFLFSQVFFSSHGVGNVDSQVCPLFVRAMWKCPIPQVMTASSGERTIGAARDDGGQTLP